jgi:Tol biopolymer transport system component
MARFRFGADVLGDAPRPLGDIVAQEARWSPRGDQLLYSNGRELRLARNDGSQSRIVASLKGVVHSPEWSPDGRAIRFTLDSSVEGAGNVENSRMLWEVAPDGTHAHALFPDWAGYATESGVWMPDGKHFVFTAGQRDARDLWAVGQKRRLFEMGSPAPVRLTAGPMKADFANPSADGRRIFFLGELIQGQLVRYDRNSQQWTSYLKGLAATQADFSGDGKWIAYVRCPQGSVWRIALDGGERLQLTSPPLVALNPRWSPDGSQIAFFGARAGEAPRLYVVPAAGGAIRQLTGGKDGSSADEDGNWTAGGTSLVFGASFGDRSVDERQRLALETINVKTQQISKLPGSEGLWSPRLSPDGRFIAALGSGNRTWLYNLETRTRTKLTTIGSGWPSWSRDGEYVYFEDNPGHDWCRVRIKDGKMERVMSLTGLTMPAASLSWVGLGPDGSPISTQAVGGTEIYALDLEAP